MVICWANITYLVTGAAPYLLGLQALRREGSICILPAKSPLTPFPVTERDDIVVFEQRNVINTVNVGSESMLLDNGEPVLDYAIKHTIHFFGSELSHTLIRYLGIPTPSKYTTFEAELPKRDQRLGSSDSRGKGGLDLSV